MGLQHGNPLRGFKLPPFLLSNQPLLRNACFVFPFIVEKRAKVLLIFEIHK